MKSETVLLVRVKKKDIQCIGKGHWMTMIAPVDNWKSVDNGGIIRQL